MPGGPLWSWFSSPLPQPGFCSLGGVLVGGVGCSGGSVGFGGLGGGFGSGLGGGFGGGGDFGGSGCDDGGFWAGAAGGVGCGFGAGVGAGVGVGVGRGAGVGEGRGVGFGAGFGPEVTGGDSDATGDAGTTARGARRNAVRIARPELSGRFDVVNWCAGMTTVCGGGAGFTTRGAAAARTSRGELDSKVALHRYPEVTPAATSALSRSASNENRTRMSIGPLPDSIGVNIGLR